MTHVLYIVAKPWTNPTQALIAATLEEYKNGSENTDNKYSLVMLSLVSVFISLHF